MRAQLDQKRFLVPLDPAVLLVPVFALGVELQVEAPQHACEDEAHFEVRETVLSVSDAFHTRRAGEGKGRERVMMMIFGDEELARTSRLTFCQYSYVARPRKAGRLLCCRWRTPCRRANVQE